jgi:hypothetical protein
LRHLSKEIVGNVQFAGERSPGGALILARKAPAAALPCRIFR